MKNSWKKFVAFVPNHVDNNNTKGKLRLALEKNMKSNTPQANTSAKKMKRFRSAFTTEQVFYLEKEFRKYPYIGNSRRKDVASVLNIPERAVKIWFQNRRMKEKKDSGNKEPEGDSKRKADIMAKSCFVGPNKDQAVSLPLLPETSSRNMTSVTHVSHKNMNVVGKTTFQGTEFITAPIPTKPTVASVIKNNSESTSNQNNLLRAVMQINKTEITGIKRMSDLYPGNKGSAVKSSGSPMTEQSSKVEHSKPTPSSCSQENKPQDLSFSRMTDNKPVTPKLFKNSTKESKPRLEAFTPYGVISPQSSGVSPVYVSGFYPNYMPPGNMIWKPIHVAPMMSTAEGTSSNVTIGPQQYTQVNCNCDCHMKTYSPVILPPNDPNHLMQYFITAVPLSGHTSV